MQDESPSQFVILWKISAENRFNFMHNYKVTPHLSDDELKKNLVVDSGECAVSYQM
jgi:hypothetical protein